MTEDDKSHFQSKCQKNFKEKLKILSAKIAVGKLWAMDIRIIARIVFGANTWIKIRAIGKRIAGE